VITGILDTVEEVCDFLVTLPEQIGQLLSDLYDDLVAELNSSDWIG
jgi:hypothetical protein